MQNRGDDMKVSEIVKLAVNGEYDKVITKIKELPPKAIGEFIDVMQNEGKDFITDFLMHLSDDQLKIWNFAKSATMQTKTLVFV